ncbi:hypothetical protein ACSSS7_006185 [Eimeria intestinalis]
MAQRHPDDDVTSEGSTITGLHHEPRPVDQARLWRWRFKNGGERLPHYAAKIPHFLSDNDAELELPGLLQALSLHEDLPEQTSELAENYVLTKQKLDGLIQEKELESEGNIAARASAPRTEHFTVGGDFYRATERCAKTMNMQLHEEKNGSNMQLPPSKPLFSAFPCRNP